MSDKFEKIIALFTKLPGIGPRQATRLVLSMLNWPDTRIKEFSDSIAQMKEGPVFCKTCFNLADDDQCGICSSPRRNRSIIAVVEKITDLSTMEKTGAFDGVYHVLGGAINPVDGFTPDKLRIKELSDRLRDADPKTEVILATSPNTHGDTTALYIMDELANSGLKVTRLARGLSSGSTLEYADETTLAHALKDRR